MSNRTIERTALAGGAGDDGPYIQQGIKEAEDLLKTELGYGPGEFVVEPVVFAPQALGTFQQSRRQRVGINKGGVVLHKRHLIDYTPDRAHYISELN